MRSGVILSLAFLFITLMALADEQMATLTADGETYHNVTITSVTATDVYFTSDKGMANVKLKKLSPQLQEHFRFNAAKVAAAETDRQQQNEVRREAHEQNSKETQKIDGTNAKFFIEDAEARVREIVNQPVREVPATRDMQNVGTSADWFHPGAEMPDYNDADIRKTQNLKYAEYTYCTSDLNPGVVFPGGEIEFNSMTKYYYTDRHLPKKKLTDTEMVEINRLYRIIGRSRDLLLDVKNSQAAAKNSMGLLTLNKKKIVIGVACFLAVLVIIRMFAGRKTA